MDQQSGILYPFFDADLNLLYLGGKGDGNIKYFEFLDGELHYLNDYRATGPGRGYGFYPKRCLDVSRNEIMRAIKLTETEVHFISFVAPRKVFFSKFSLIFSKRIFSQIVYQKNQH